MIRSCVGVDGCRAGWCAVRRRRGAASVPELRVVSRFAELLAREDASALLAVDMPIGLPDRTGPGGRGPEAVVRPFLGDRQSSVFSIPARAVVYCEPGPFPDDAARYAAHRRASALARTLSDPPRGIAIQAFGLFPKIREIDRLMKPELQTRVFECHPELAFWRLNGERAMALPKKIKNRPNPAGLAERQTLLEQNGIPSGFFVQPLPSGVGPDDRIDAAALALIAERIANGTAQSFPADPARDANGLQMAIWA